MRHLIRSSALAGVLALAACGHASPAAPSGGSGSSAAMQQTSGHVVDILSGAGITGVTPVSTDHDITTVMTDVTGAFTVKVAGSSAGTVALSFGVPGIVTRQTFVKVPGDPVTITAIASSFDLPAFNEMCRSSLISGSPVLMRWTTAPPLVIQTQTMQYTDISNAQFTTLSDTLSDTEYNGLVADLNWALPQMSGGQFGGFAGTTRQNSAPGTAITMLVSGQISIGRFVGLTAATGFAGYTRWQFRSDGVVTAGMIMLDRDFERSGATTLRALRTHELGHALGYNHVTVRTSVMNSTARFEPNAFDLSATKIAFLRQPGNHTPDIDPTGFSTNSLKLTWSAPIH